MSADITVNTTETNVNINAATIVETVDITATVQQDVVEIEVFPNVTVVNVTKKEGQDGQDGTDGVDGQDLTLSDFSVAPESESLNNTDKFLIEQGGVWKSITKENLKIELEKQEILLSVRKIGDGSDNRAFKLKRTSDNTLADIYFDENGEISANSQTSAGVIFGDWVIGNLGAGSLQVFIWYNQSPLGSLYDAILYRGSTYATYDYNTNELIFYNSSFYFYTQFYVGNKYARFDLYKVGRSGFTGSDNFMNLEQWANGAHRCYAFTNTHQIYNAALNNHYIGNLNNNQMLLHTDKIFVGGSSDDDTQNIFFFLNGIELMTVNKNRDHNTGTVLYGIQGGLNSLCEVRRKEYRMYNYHPDIQEINNNIVSYYNL